MARPDAKLQQLRVLIGHADISATAGYLHQRDEDLEATVDGPPSRALLAVDARRRSARDLAPAPRLQPCGPGPTPQKRSRSVRLTRSIPSTIAPK